MSNFVFENQGVNTYLVYELGEEDIDTLSLGMITNNNISSFAPVVFTQMNSQKYLKYNISAKVAMRQFFVGTINKKRLLGVFSSIIDALLMAEDYMIDQNSLVMDSDHIYVDVSTCKAVLICLPVMNSERTGCDYLTFFKNIVFGIQFDQAEDCDYVAKIINYLNSTSSFSLCDYKNLIDNLMANGLAITPMKATSPVPPVLPPKVEMFQNANAVGALWNVQPVVETTPVEPVHSEMSKWNVPGNNAQTTYVPNGGNPVIQKPVKQKGFSLLSNKNKDSEGKREKKKQAAQSANKKSAMNNKKTAAMPRNIPVIPSQLPTNQMQYQQYIPQVQNAIPPTANRSYQQAGIIPSGAVQPGMPQTGMPQTRIPQTGIPQTGIPQQGIQENFMRNDAGAGAYNFGETTVLNGESSGETTVLGVDNSLEVTPYLVRIRNNDIIKLNKPIFRIGKEKSYVDYFIGDNTAVSRSHANIISKGNEYFIVDTNSTNHTFVNGTMLQSNIETKLAHGAKIRLSNEEFEFKIY